MISGRIGFVADKVGLGLLSHRCNQQPHHPPALQDALEEVMIITDQPPKMSCKRRGLVRRLLILLMGTML